MIINVQLWKSCKKRTIGMNNPKLDLNIREVEGKGMAWEKK